MGQGLGRVIRERLSQVVFDSRDSFRGVGGRVLTGAGFLGWRRVGRDGEERGSSRFCCRLWRGAGASTSEGALVTPWEGVRVWSQRGRG